MVGLGILAFCNLGGDLGADFNSGADETGQDGQAIRQWWNHPGKLLAARKNLERLWRGSNRAPVGQYLLDGLQTGVSTLGRLFQTDALESAAQSGELDPSKSHELHKDRVSQHQAAAGEAEAAALLLHEPAT